MTGAATVGAANTGATDWLATGICCSVATAATGCTAAGTARVTACTRAARGVELALGSAVTRSGIATEATESTEAAGDDVFPAGVRSGRAGAVVRGVDPESPRRAPVSAAGRLQRVRVVGPAESARADEAASVPASEGSAGFAQADPAPPVTTAAPIPSATARPPTRPTWADARFTLNLPTALRTSARQRTRLR